MKSTAFRLTAAVTLLISSGISSVNAQNDPTKINVVTTAVPFLRISPDARAGGMGDLGIATSADASSSYYNIAKVPFNESNAGLNVTYTPWLKRLVNDVYLASMSGFYKLDDNQALSGSLRYFSLGSIQFTDQFGNQLGTGNPREFGIDVGYSRKLSAKTSIGVGLKYIYSNLASGSAANVGTYKAGSSVAGDLGIFHNGQNAAGQGFTFGAAFTNLGAKIAYTNNADAKDFIPANFGIGATYTTVLDESNKIMFGVDLNKLLVPTPPSFLSPPSDPNDQDYVDSVNNARATTYRTKSVVGSWFSSFGDAPGGFGEEMREFSVSAGAEYWYNNQFALRGGYFFEDKTKGNRRYFTAGVGIKYNVFGLNFSYLIPTGSGNNQNPLANTLRFSLVFDLSGNAAGGTTTNAGQ
jgi:hypothetical protein